MTKAQSTKRDPVQTVLDRLTPAERTDAVTELDEQRIAGFRGGWPRMVVEQFYVVTCFLNGEYRETQHYGQSREEAVKVAALSSRAPMIASVHSTIENNPVEVWCKGSYFRRYADAVEHGGAV